MRSISASPQHSKTQSATNWFAITPSRVASPLPSNAGTGHVRRDINRKSGAYKHVVQQRRARSLREDFQQRPLLPAVASAVQKSSLEPVAYEASGFRNRLSFPVTNSHMQTSDSWQRSRLTKGSLGGNSGTLLFNTTADAQSHIQSSSSPSKHGAFSTKKANSVSLNGSSGIGFGNAMLPLEKFTPQQPLVQAASPPPEHKGRHSLSAAAAREGHDLDAAISRALHGVNKYLSRPDACRSSANPSSFGPLYV